MKIKWNPNSDNSEFRADINGYHLLVTSNSVFIFWGVFINGSVFTSSFNKKNQRIKTIKEAQQLAEEAYLKHYTKDLIFPDDI